VGQLSKKHGLKVRALESTPVSRASFGTRCGGIRVQSYRRTLSLDAVGIQVRTREVLEMQGIAGEFLARKKKFTAIGSSAVMALTTLFARHWALPRS
jgi:hypothetical protein